jgi:hypothetical protein
LKAERQVSKLVLTLLPKGVRNAYDSCHSDAGDCKICAVVFRACVEHAQVLVVGAILAPGKRTVTAILRVMGLSAEAHFQNYHRVLNRAQWSSLYENRETSEMSGHHRGTDREAKAQSRTASMSVFEESDHGVVCA